MRHESYGRRTSDIAVCVANLGHDLPSLARALGSWVRIPLEAWMSVCVYSVFMLVKCLATGWSLVQGVLPNVLD
jgi:hypothetical protein